jgi:hypothetical protein
MRAIFPLVCLMLCGCALLFPSGTKEIGVGLLRKNGQRKGGGWLVVEEFEVGG